ncbi:uncharacterized protein LOC131032120 [Cryptomeria japonica]|uniref:uncharacterized protein LOC131032120 n=1 Tax=Cryptomeria japonica TaxID=3369 RepID=UPI0027DA1A73|nr:uncharacterized protein LOC131032120 [Cryptomeria japonica]XP_057819032.2 uncharacterized protein LOC131032120 [Cryptomeria japonica]
MAEVQKKRVVIVGGGVAGANTAKALENHADVTLIDPKEYFEIPWARLRCMVEPSFAERSVFLHSEYLKKTTLIMSTVTGATEEAVITASGEQVKYDYLVIATGTPFDGPSSRAQRLQQFEADNKKIKDAKTILIIGGGPTGVELAAEIVVDFPEKKVILLHSGPRLIDFLGEKASRKALDWMKENNVEVHLNERIDLNNISETTLSFTTNIGKTIMADCHFVCIGKKMGSSWMKDSMLRDVVDERGQIKVYNTLRVDGTTNVFAVGDIINVKELKQGVCAQKHASVVAENIKKLSKGSDESKLGTYKPSSDIALVTLGRYIAIAQLPFGTFSGRLPGMLKSKDLFVGPTRKGFGLKY